MLRKIALWFEELSYARAAAELSRRGYFEEAKALMLQKDYLRKE